MKRFSLAIFLLSLLSCSDDTAPRPANFVVEGFITANQVVNDIKIKDTSPIDSAVVAGNPITDAQVTVSLDQATFPLDFNPLTGLYENEEVTISAGETYFLEVTVGERQAMAQTRVPDLPINVRLSDATLAIPQLALSFSLGDEISALFDEERILLEWDSIPGQNYFVVIESRVEELDPILPEGIPAQAEELLSSFRFISEPSEFSSFEIIGVALETYGPHVAKVFTVNQEYLDLFNNVEQDSRDLNEPPSNVDNALGIFTAFGSDSVLFNVVRR